MKQKRRRKCLHCFDLYRPDPRNLRHQRYCSKSECRRASKAASQRRWLSKAENQDYYRGVANVQRVQAWRDAHPGYSKRTTRQDDSALQEDSSAQTKGTSRDLAAVTLQDLLALVVTADTVARTVMAPQQLPVGVTVKTVLRSLRTTLVLKPCPVGTLMPLILWVAPLSKGAHGPAAHSTPLPGTATGY